MLKDVKPGKFTAKAVGGIFELSKEKGTPRVKVWFEFQNEGNREVCCHTAFFTDTMRKDGITVKEATFNTLALLGYSEEKPLHKKMQGDKEVQYFDKDHLADIEVSIEIEIEQHENKSYHKVKWVNALGGSMVAGMGVQQVFGNAGLRADMAAARARMGAPRPKAAATTPAPQTELPGMQAGHDEIPF